MTRVALVVTAFLVAAACGGDDAASTGEGVTAGIGDTVDDGYFAYTLESFNCGPDIASPESPNFEVRDPSGQWCVAEVTAENTSDEPRAWIASVAGATLTDSGGRIYEADFDTQYAANYDSGGLIESVNPGLSSSGTVWLDVPLDIEAATLIFYPEELRPEFGEGPPTAAFEVSDA